MLACFFSQRLPPSGQRADLSNSPRTACTFPVKGQIVASFHLFRLDGLLCNACTLPRSYKSSLRHHVNKWMCPCPSRMLFRVTDWRAGIGPQATSADPGTNPCNQDSCSKHFQISYHMPGIVLGARNSAVTKTQAFALVKLIFQLILEVRAKPPGHFSSVLHCIKVDLGQRAQQK